MHNVHNSNPLCDNLELFEFVGRLMAACILSEERLVVNLPGYIWMKIAGAQVGTEGVVCQQPSR